jgi:hypothetical protein
MKIYILILTLVLLSLPGTFAREAVLEMKPEEQIYLKAIREDFSSHRQNVTQIYEIGMSIVHRIDSLFSGQRADTVNTGLLRGIMVTRPYDRTIMAYRDILNGIYISDSGLKLQIARHIARFENFADAKRNWDNQWDITARPFIYKHGLLSHPGMFGAHEAEEHYNLYRDPEFRTVLWDRRMFAFDVTYITPILLESVDAIIARIDELLKNEY